MKRTVYILLLLSIDSSYVNPQASFFQEKATTFVIGDQLWAGPNNWGRWPVAHLPIL
jgi:hypothetical protein